MQAVLTACQPFPGDGPPVDPSYRRGDQRFEIEDEGSNTYCIYDRVQGFESRIHTRRLRWKFFSIGKWFAERCASFSGLDSCWIQAHHWLLNKDWNTTIIGLTVEPSDDATSTSFPVSQAPEGDAIELGGVQVDRNKYSAVQRNSAKVKSAQRVLPKPVVVKVTVNGHPARALLDSGSLGDFISSTLADQLNVQRQILDTPVPLQLAVQGSRSRINAVATVQLSYQGIDETRTLDIINISSYDLILGTPWLYQHEVCVGLNPARVVIGSDESQPLKAGTDTKLMIHSLSHD